MLRAFVSWIKSIFVTETIVKEPVRELPLDEHGTNMIKLGVIVGHTKSAPGAYLHDGDSEYKYNSAIANLMKAGGLTKGIHVEVFHRDGIGIAGAYAKANGKDCVIELHFNAYNKKAYGTETLCSTKQDDRIFAKHIQDAMCKVFSRTGAGNRGVKAISASDRGGASVSALPLAPNCLVEPFFGDNPKEAELAMSLMVPYANCLLDGVNSWATEVGLKR